jgi:hypothetical protein
MLTRFAMRIDVSLHHRDIEHELASLHARMQRPGDVLHGMPVVALVLPGLALKFREADGEFYVYVEDASNGALAGCTVFGRLLEVDGAAGRHVRSPHSRYADRYQRRGLASAVYRWALQAGLCLVTGPRQSPAAHRLWLSLAGSHELAWVRVQDRRLCIAPPPPDRSTFEDFNTRMLLLGDGWSPDRFAGFAH